MEHKHGHSKSLTNINQAFIIGIVLNILFVIAEFFAGLHFSSLALVSDAGHNLTDVFSLLISLLAFKTIQIKGNERYTYGYKKSTILASLINAVLLLFVVGGIIWEAIRRFKEPHVVEGGVISNRCFHWNNNQRVIGISIFQRQDKGYKY